jgi:hypothetical protein
MSIGTGIVLFVVGAILSFALNVQATWIDLHLVGYILMGAGVVVFILGLIFMLRRRTSTTTVQHGVDANGQNVSQSRTSTTPDDL